MPQLHHAGCSFGSAAGCARAAQVPLGCVFICVQMLSIFFFPAVPSACISSNMTKRKNMRAQHLPFPAAVRCAGRLFSRARAYPWLGHRYQHLFHLLSLSLLEARFKQRTMRSLAQLQQAGMPPKCESTPGLRPPNHTRLSVTTSGPTCSLMLVNARLLPES